MHNLIDEQIPSDLKQKLQAKSINKFSKPSKNSLTDFIKSTYTTTDQLQDKFQQPNLEEILNICKFKNKDQAIKVLYETLNYVEILWYQMIINKTIEYLLGSFTYIDNVFTSNSGGCTTFYFHSVFFFPNYVAHIINMILPLRINK